MLTRFIGRALAVNSPSLLHSTTSNLEDLTAKTTTNQQRFSTTNIYATTNTVMSRPAARKAAPKGEYIETVSDNMDRKHSMCGPQSSQHPDICSMPSLLNVHVQPSSFPVFSQLCNSIPSHLSSLHRDVEICEIIFLTLTQDSGNKVSRRAAITGTANITLGGRTVIMADVQLRGDLKPTRPMPSQSGKETTPISINIGRCTVISTGSVIKPPARISRGQVHYYPMKIGDNVFVGEPPSGIDVMILCVSDFC